eukprot:TRINITY_DN32418_c0_g1_i1.p1 TRINITY_DN32418_c0_g1~~TRINITY_DN32418_c0_g1_i1.p1  ORF type:complete len:431 (+),score=69.67 TRINITY_DN32418_c0_g1_i1:67-1293(+)
MPTRTLQFLCLCVWSLVSAAVPHSVPLGKTVLHSPPRSRFLELHGNGSSIPAGGSVWPTGIFWTMVQVGTPPQDFPVAIDSGSGNLNIAGKGCSGCVTTAPNRAYDHSASTTAKRAFPFVFSNSYQTCDLKNPTAPCTISGGLFTDQVSLAGLGPVSVKLGSITKQTSNFDQFKQIDGVIGFTMGGNSNVYKQLVAAGKCADVWALCMHEGSQSNGTLTIGGADSRLADGQITYVPDSGALFHSVSVASLKLGESTIEVGESAILDTGTNVLLLPSAVFAQVHKSMCSDASLAGCNELWSNNCVTMTDAQMDAYPPLALQLDGVALQMTSHDYLLLGSPLASSAGQVCLGIRDGGSAGGSGFIIGDTTMRNYYLVFDLAEKKIGWGKVNKKTCGSALPEITSESTVVV